jgi:hypothetical protein
MQRNVSVEREDIVHQLCMFEWQHDYELETSPKEAVVFLLSFYPVVYKDEPKKPTECVNQEIRCPKWDPNLDIPEEEKSMWSTTSKKPV